MDGDDDDEDEEDDDDYAAGSGSGSGSGSDDSDDDSKGGSESESGDVKPITKSKAVKKGGSDKTKLSKRGRLNLKREGKKRKSAKRKIRMHLSVQQQRLWPTQIQSAVKCKKRILA